VETEDVDPAVKLVLMVRVQLPLTDALPLVIVVLVNLLVVATVNA